jgi:hypothetical protein
MKEFWFRGRSRKVGTVKIPSPEAMAAFHAKGMFHDVFGSLPPAPPSVDYITPALAALATMLGNGPDATLPPGVPPVGDCIIAEDLHLAALRACNAGAPWVPTTAEALAAYSAITGYVQGNAATDQGTDPLQLVTYRTAGNAYPDGSTLLAAIAVDATNAASLKQAIWLADGIFMWASLPDQWESEENGGDVWDVVGDPNQNNGHGFAGASYGGTRGNILLSEWGEDNPPVELTFPAAAKYCIPSAGGGVIALLGSNIISSVTGKCPAGYDLSDLTAYLNGLGAPALPTPAAPSGPSAVPPRSGRGAPVPSANPKGRMFSFPLVPPVVKRPLTVPVLSAPTKVQLPRNR